MILPTSHIPLAEIIIEDSFFSFNAFDSSAVLVNCKPGNSSGLSPLSITACVSSSNKFAFSLNISVAEIARIEYIEGYSGHADQEWLMNFVYSFITKPKHIFLVHGEPTGQEILKSKIVDEIGLPVTIPEYGQTYTLDENLTMEQTVAPITPQMNVRRDVMDKIRLLKNELNDMETIVKEDYLAKKDNEEEISLLKLRLKEIEDQIVKIVEKN